MNVGDTEARAPIDPTLWDAPAMRAALANHDIATVFHLLKRAGVSQGRIAALTGHTQPDVSRIMNRRHMVQAYAVLDRIATGLGIPRGLMGLAYAPGADPLAVDERGALVRHGARDTREGEAVHRRMFFALMAQAAIVGGLSEVDLDRLAASTGSPAPGVALPGKVGNSDAVALENAVQLLWTQDDLLGGGAVRAAANGCLSWAESLAAAPASDAVKRRIQTAHADLHSVAGWAAFDTGDHASAKKHLATGLSLARDCDQLDLAATILWQLGRIFLHAKDPDGALKMFNLGQTVAQDTDTPHASALMSVNSAWAYGEMGKPQQVQALLTRASIELDSSRGDAPKYLEFMNHAEIHGIAGMAYNALSARNRSYGEQALQHATASRDARPDTNARARASDGLAIAAAMLRVGGCDAGVQAAHSAIEAASAIHSSRLADRQAWIVQAAKLHPHHSGARELVAALSGPKGV
ncbi:helix-turn-helix domain-containing protein [Actinokineospora enzanensis]|uniref:helix-turn-helix domain-containing protein n=1 Tax=Actinokineospora enzanensis TaxID=155975 RepID=UPI001FDEA79D|nr:helix-turn-helix transcriptional regulator [Actinokineospora enzanensis]